MEVKKITIPDGWEIDKFENGEITFKENKKEPHKKEFPKTWEECYYEFDKGEYISSSGIINDVTVSENNMFINMLPVGLGKPLIALCQLLVCRDVYRGGWKPDYDDDEEYKYAIKIEHGRINTVTYINTQRVLSFQSEEICDRFIKNFRDLIEEAKELI